MTSMFGRIWPKASHRVAEIACRAMEWAEDNGGADYIFGLPGNATL
jgi:hypothetical protein